LKGNEVTGKQYLPQTGGGPAAGPQRRTRTDKWDLYHEDLEEHEEGGKGEAKGQR